MLLVLTVLKSLKFLLVYPEFETLQKTLLKVFCNRSLWS